MADLFNMDTTLRLDGDSAAVLSGSPKNLDTESFWIKGETLLQMSVSDVEEALSDIGETSSVMDASFEIAKNSSDLAARVEQLEMCLAISEKKNQ